MSDEPRDDDKPLDKDDAELGATAAAMGGAASGGASTVAGVAAKEPAVDEDEKPSTE